MSISGESNLVVISINILGLSYHSVLLLNIQEKLFASILCFPGMCAAEMIKLFLDLHKHFFL